MQGTNLASVLISLGLAMAGGRVSAAAQVVRNYDITFTEVQGYAPPQATNVPGLTLGTRPFQGRQGGQKQRLALTVRGDRTFDLVSERNFGAIYQYRPTAQQRSGQHLQREATGALGSWSPIVGSFFQNAQVKVDASANVVRIDERYSNVTEIISITEHDDRCDVTIEYSKPDTDSVYVLRNLRTNTNDTLDILRASDIQCTIGNGAIF